MSKERVPNWLNKRAALTPQRIAIYFDNESLTFARLNENAQKIARKFAKLGLKKGDHVALLLNNGIHTVEIIHALEYLGVVMVLLNNRLTSSELCWQLKDSKTTLLLSEEDFNENVSLIMSEYPQLKKITTKELLEIKGIDAPLLLEFDLNNVHTIIYTSGTTGKPKGVILTYENHWYSAVNSALNLGLDMNDCWLLCVPIFHVSGISILMRSVIYGIAVNLHKSFNPEKVNEVIVSKRVTIISVVSIMLTRMLNKMGSFSYPESLRCVLLGGGSVPQSLLKECKKLNIPVFQTYGMTETASQIATLSPEFVLSKMGSAGKPLFCVELKIIKEGNEQGPGEAGEIVVKGPIVTKGYYGLPEETLKNIKNGWLNTGDLGYVDEDGFLYVLDRRSDLIISGGENVYPAEIESVILQHSAVEDVGVIGKEDVKWGRVPIAFVKLKNEEKITEKELSDFCSQRLAKYKIPVSFYFIDELPRNASNKLLRRKLVPSK